MLLAYKVEHLTYCNNMTNTDKLINCLKIQRTLGSRNNSYIYELSKSAACLVGLRFRIPSGVWTPFSCECCVFSSDV
jgi:hypothetical protein